MMQLHTYRPTILAASLASVVCLLSACGGGGAAPDAAPSAEASAAPTESPAAFANTSWVRIASESGSFSVASNTKVRYGAGSSWVYKTVSAGTHACSNAFFGTDPAYGVHKECDARTASTTTTSPSASLSWQAPGDPAVVGYRIYYGTASNAYQQPLGSGVAAGNVTSYTVGGLQSATTYYFAVTSIDASGHESAYSNEATKVTP